VETSDATVALELAVRDHGIGIAAENLDKIFEAFAQADASTSGRFGGTGLGLAICRGLAQMMGGSLDVESTLDVGSTFTLRASFPVRDAPVARPSIARTLSGRNIQYLRVLVADDYPVNQKIIRKLLELHGCIVDVVNNGSEAVAAITAGNFDLILMDCQMPVMDGFSATRELRALGCTLPIIALTASVMAGDRERCVAAGMDDYIAKPVRAEAVHAILVRWAGTKLLSP
jgi:CheY-like chemotaxis protein